MLIIIAALVVLGIITALITYFSKDKTKDEPIVAPDDDCCGAHEICEVDLSKLSEEIIYFEDEELDKFQNVRNVDYSDDDIEQFREVLYTLPTNEINDCLRSLEMRKIELPDILKNEALMILND